MVANTLVPVGKEVITPMPYLAQKLHEGMLSLWGAAGIKKKLSAIDQPSKSWKGSKGKNRILAYNDVLFHFRKLMGADRQLKTSQDLIDANSFIQSWKAGKKA